MDPLLLTWLLGILCMLIAIPILITASGDKLEKYLQGTLIASVLWPIFLPIFIGMTIGDLLKKKKA